MRIAFVADPIETLDASIDTTVGLMHAAQDRRAEIWATQVENLEATDGRAYALARQVSLAPSRPAGDHRWTVADDWFTATETRLIELDTMTAVFMRTNPPVNKAYVDATLILDLVDPMATAMVNDPRGLRVCNGKLYAMQFPELIPPTIVTASTPKIRSFVDEHKVAVIKPIDGHGGNGVLRLELDDPNLPSLIEISTHHGTRAVVAQTFLVEVADGNKRIFVIDGKPVGGIYRFRRDSDFRLGDPSGEAPLTARDREICARLAPSLARHGLRMVGVDVIGTYLIEINVASPGAMRKADGLLGWSLCADALDMMVPTHHRSMPSSTTSSRNAHPRAADQA